MKRKITLFDIFNHILLFTYVFICIYPLWYILVISFSTFKGYYASTYHIIPNSFSLQSYIDIFVEKSVPRGFWVSTKVTALGTTLSMLLTCMAGYVFSKKNLPGIGLMFKFVIFTMYFSGGLIPVYLLMRDLHLRNTLFALILPGCISAFNVILAKTFFEALPGSLEESAKIDGANDFTILIKIIVPMSTPVIAALSLFYGVGYWNDYMSAVFYITDIHKVPLQLVVRNILNGVTGINGAGIEENSRALRAFALRMSAVIITMIPIIMVYPFVQRYFTKGIMIGAVKE